MSIWAGVSGTIYVRKDSHISIKEAFSKKIDELSIKTESEDRGDYWLHRVDATFCADGMEACKIVDDVVKYIKAQCKTAQVDLNVSIRWVA